MALACLLRPEEFFQMLRGIPKYALIGIGCLLAVEVISGLFFSPSHLAKTAVAARCIKTMEFLLAAAFASRVGSLAELETGWIFYGVLQVLAAVVIQVTTGSVLGFREGALGGVMFELGSVSSVAGLIANLGFMSIVSAWFAASLALRKTGMVKLLLWVIAVLSVGAAFYSGRRQALLAVFLSVILASVTTRGPRRLGIVVVSASVLIGFYLSGPLQQFLHGRESLAVEFAGSEESKYAPINKAGIAAFLDHPFLGIGLGNYNSATEEMNVLKRSSAKEGLREGDGSHNSVIRIIAETGLLGAIGLTILSCGFILTLIRVVISLRRSIGITPMHLIIPCAGLILTGYTITILDAPEYIFLFGQMVGLMHQYLNGTIGMGQENINIFDCYLGTNLTYFDS
jgi:O-antigen ligase